MIYIQCTLYAFLLSHYEYTRTYCNLVCAMPCILYILLRYMILMIHSFFWTIIQINLLLLFRFNINWLLLNVTTYMVSYCTTRCLLLQARLQIMYVVLNGVRCRFDSSLIFNSSSLSLFDHTKYFNTRQQESRFLLISKNTYGMYDNGWKEHSFFLYTVTVAIIVLLIQRTN